MEQLTKNQAVATSQEAVQNQNEPQLQASHFVHIPGLSYSGVKSPTECQQSLFESHFASQIGRASCRERVYISVVVSWDKNRCCTCVLVCISSRLCVLPYFVGNLYKAA